MTAACRSPNAYVASNAAIHVSGVRLRRRASRASTCRSSRPYLCARKKTASGDGGAGGLVGCLWGSGGGAWLLRGIKLRAHGGEVGADAPEPPAATGDVWGPILRPAAAAVEPDAGVVAIRGTAAGGRERRGWVALVGDDDLGRGGRGVLVLDEDEDGMGGAGPRRGDEVDATLAALRAPGERRPEAAVPTLEVLLTVRMSASSTSSSGTNDAYSQLSSCRTRRAIAVSTRTCAMTVRTLSTLLNRISSV